MAENGGLDSLFPPWLQAVGTVGGVILLYLMTMLGKFRDPSPAARGIVTRDEFTEVFVAQRDTLQNNRETLLAIRDNTNRIANTNDEILRLFKQQASDDRDDAIANRVAERIVLQQRLHHGRHGPHRDVDSGED